MHRFDCRIARTGLQGGLLVLLAAAPALGRQEAPKPSPAPPSAPTFPAGVELVTVDVVVLSPTGQPVPGLQAEDFSVAEEGRPQAIASFEAVTLPESERRRPSPRPRVSVNTAPSARPERTFVIVFDDAHLSPINAQKTKAALDEFLKDGLRDGDQVTVVPTAGGAWWSARLPEGRDGLCRFLARLDGKRLPDTSAGRITDFEAMQIQFGRDKDVQGQVMRRYYENGLIAEVPTTEPRTRAELDIDPGVLLVRAKATEVYNQALHRNRATLRILERTVASLASAKGRKSVVLVSEGFIHDPTLTEMKDVVRASRQASAAVYFVDARAISSAFDLSSAEFGRAIEERDVLFVDSLRVKEAEGAESIAADTGGLTIKGSDLADGLGKMADRSRAYYLIGYVPTAAKRDGKFRSIKVAVRRPGVTVQARRGYYAPSDEKRPPQPDALDPKVREALDSPYGRNGIPLRMSSYVFGQASGGKAAVVLVAEADPAALGLKERGGSFEGALTSMVVVASRDTGENYSQERRLDIALPGPVRHRMTRTWLPMFREFELPAGAYQARLLVRDERNGALGTVLHEFEVPAAGQFYVSTPILTDTVQQGQAGDAASARPLPIARRTFASGEPLIVLFEVFGAARDPQTGGPRVTAEAVLQHADGSLFTRVTPTAMRPGPQGQLSRRQDLSLAQATPGEYVLVLKVSDEVSGRALELREPFDVETGPRAEAATPQPPVVAP